MIVLKCPNNDLGLLEFYYLESCILVFSGCATLNVLDRRQTCKKWGLLYCERWEEKASRIKYRIVATVCLSLLTGIEDYMLTMKHCIRLLVNSFLICLLAYLVFVKSFYTAEAKKSYAVATYVVAMRLLVAKPN